MGPGARRAGRLRRVLLRAGVDRAAGLGAAPGRVRRRPHRRDRPALVVEALEPRWLPVRVRRRRPRGHRSAARGPQARRDDGARSGAGGRDRRAGRRRPRRGPARRVPVPARGPHRCPDRGRLPDRRVRGRSLPVGHPRRALLGDRRLAGRPGHPRRPRRVLRPRRRPARPSRPDRHRRTSSSRRRPASRPEPAGATSESRRVCCARPGRSRRISTNTIDSSPAAIRGRCGATGRRTILAPVPVDRDRSQDADPRTLHQFRWQDLARQWLGTTASGARLVSRRLPAGRIPPELVRGSSVRASNQPVRASSAAPTLPITCAGLRRMSRSPQRTTR